MKRFMQGKAGREASGKDEGVEPLSYEQLVQLAPSMEALLKEKGASLDDAFNDYQVYIEKVQQRYPTKISLGDQVPVRGNLHLPLDLVSRQRDVDDVFADDAKWQIPESCD